MGISEVIASVVEPANKLIDAVTRAVGKAYEPRHMRKMADAKAYELNVICEELRNNSDLPIVCDAIDGFSIDMSDYEALTKRAGKRIAFQEIVKQENIEAIVDNAYEALIGSESLVEGDISREWMNRFIDSAGNISTEEMRKIWSKVLAGEVLYPTSFSLRTLECLKNMDVSDAKLFSLLCTLIVDNNMVISDDSFLVKHGINYDSILKLDEGGLINSSSTISRRFEIDSAPKIVLLFDGYILIASSDEKRTLSFGTFPLTTAGRELSKIVDEKMEFSTIKEICRFVQTKNKGVTFSLHKVKFRKGDEINYENEAIDFA